MKRVTAAETSISGCKAKTIDDCAFSRDIEASSVSSEYKQGLYSAKIRVRYYDNLIVGSKC